MGVLNLPLTAGPIRRSLLASANKMCLLKANVILVLGQKSADSGLAFLPACLLNS